MARKYKTESGALVEVEEETGPTSYPTGGFTVSTELGRVNSAQVDTDDPAYEARNTGASGTEFTVVATDPSGTEVSAGTDISSVTFNYTAKRL